MPDSKISEQPEYAKNATRAVRDGIPGARRHLHPPGLPAEGALRARRMPELGADWPGGFFCPCHGSRFDLAGRVFDGSPASAEPAHPGRIPSRMTTRWSSASMPPPREPRDGRQQRRTARAHGLPRLAQQAPAGRRVRARPAHRLLRAEELQLLVLLRRAVAGGAGAAAGHRHLPHHALQGGRGHGLRLGRIHHARGAVRLAAALHALHRRLVLLHRRLPAHVPRAAVRLVQGAARAAVAVRHGRSISR